MLDKQYSYTQNISQLNLDMKGNYCQVALGTAGLQYCATAKEMWKGKQAEQNVRSVPPCGFMKNHPTASSQLQHIF